MKIDKKTLNKAIVKWGADAQLEIIIEECIELALALQKFKRHGGDREQKVLSVIDEIADVRIMIEQAIILFGEPSNKIQERIDFKMNRLKQRIEA